LHTTLKIGDLRGVDPTLLSFKLRPSYRYESIRIELIRIESNRIELRINSKLQICPVLPLARDGSRERGLLGDKLAIRDDVAVKAIAAEDVQGIANHTRELGGPYSFPFMLLRLTPGTRLAVFVFMQA
jgi:hypothetical protein